MSWLTLARTAEEKLFSDRTSLPVINRNLFSPRLHMERMKEYSHIE
jgi:hypothetical protein